jgi:hypothetical protein
LVLPASAGACSCSHSHYPQPMGIASLEGSSQDGTVMTAPACHPRGWSR